MYPTQLFEVVVHKVICHDPHGLTYRTYTPPKRLLYAEETGAVLETVKDVYLPRHRIVERSVTGAKVETYLAISPDLLPLIEAPFAARIANLEYELVGAVQQLAVYRGKISGYQDRIATHNNLPWWRRWFHRV